MRRQLAGTLVAALIAALLPALAAQPAAAATFPAGLSDTVVAGGLGSPTAVANLPDGRLLVTSQGGTLWLVQTNGTKSVALDLAALSKICSDSEEGLLGVTVDPQFASNGFIYLYYTARVGSVERSQSGRCEEPRVALHDDGIDRRSDDGDDPARQHARVGREPQRR
jgi:glucose/arabinose dehydrogenase